MDDSMKNVSHHDAHGYSSEAGNESNTNGRSVSQNRRQDDVTCDQYCMALAFLSGQRSKDPITQVGACIVSGDSDKILATGYNGMPNGCSDDTMPWGKDAADELQTKRFYVCHAEMNAIVNAGTADVRKSRIYVTLFPCNECAKQIVQSGIREVIYFSDKFHFKEKYKASRRIFEHTGIKVRQYDPTERRTFLIDFDALE